MSRLGASCGTTYVNASSVGMRQDGLQMVAASAYRGSQRVRPHPLTAVIARTLPFTRRLCRHWLQNYAQR